jgi:hypothetical protein
MATINQAQRATIKELSDKLKDLRSSACVEEAAQRCVTLCYDEFRDSIVLVRLFATVPFGKLPAANQAFVRKLAEAKAVASQIEKNTLVLSLLGTRGLRPDWNDRHDSQGHVGIPLVSASFVESIPMIARLFKELGLQLDWIDKQDTAIVANVLGGNLAGLFHVPDARNALDHKGRHIIAAQDFVASHGVKTVFGMGGGYLNGTLMAIVFFTHEAIDKAQATNFMPLVNVFKAATTDLVMKERIFAA